MENSNEAYDYAVLIIKHLKGELSVSEEIKLKAWVNSSPENLRLMEQFQNESMVQGELDFYSSIDKKSAWKNIVSRGYKTSFTQEISLFIRKWKYAAVLFAAIITGSLWFANNKAKVLQQQQTAGIVKSRFKNDIPPGTAKARLILADGSVMAVNGNSPGIVKTSGNLSIASQYGVLTCKTVGLAKAGDAIFNTISTPKGGKYKVKLPDGSLVWLNSESSLKFPLAFGRHERRVFLTGEAYFEVAKNKHKPFRVFANNSVIQVLGTHFNVQAYKNEAVEKTTLLEGSVKIFNKQSSKLIAPGQQACIAPNSKSIQINNIDVKEIVAWKDDLFVFDSEGIESVMREVARWYDVEVEYKDPVPQIHFSGSISRSNNISQLLNMLELTGGVHFGIDGRKITVTR